jgi:hypothetical protein
MTAGATASKASEYQDLSDRQDEAGLAGKPEQAREVLRRLEQLSQDRYVSPYHMAYVYTGLGEADRAMDFLERAYQERAGSVYGIKGSYLFTSLRSHPRFQALLRKMNLG